MNPIQKFIVLNLFENTPEVFGFIHKMNVIKAKNKVENLAFKYKAAKVELVELNEKNQENFVPMIHDFIRITDEEIAGSEYLTDEEFHLEMKEMDDWKNTK
jgi:hypothetical protein